MSESLVIIGAGVAGLSAGCYARMNGYPTTILEMADTPGGLCTSWQRKGYRFDGSVAGLAGSAVGSPLYRLWQEIGVAGRCPLHAGRNFGHIHGTDGRVVTVHANVEALEAHLLDVFPSEAVLVRELSGALRSVMDLDPPFPTARGPAALREAAAAAVSVVGHLPALLKYGGMTIRQFASRARDPFLKIVLQNLVHFGGPDVPMLTILLPLAYAHRGMAGFPRQGWLSFARTIERRFLDLGGEIRYRSRVRRLLVEQGLAAGVALSDGSRLPAKIVLSAADGQFTRFDLLGKHEGESLPLFPPERLSDQPAQVNLGVAEGHEHEDGPVTYILDPPINAAGRSQDRITVHANYYDDSAAPAGKTAVTVFLDSDYAWWKTISADPGRYAAEKERAAGAVIEAIGRYRPGFRSRVEVIDVATPLSRERYTGNRMGAMQAMRPASSMVGALTSGGPRYDYPGIRGFFMTGQWVESWGGVTTAAQSARKAVAAICRASGRKFAARVD